MTVADVCRALDRLAPPELALSGDPNGLLLGDSSAPVTVIRVALDISDELVSTTNPGTMLIAHHPLLFHPLRTIRESDPFPAPVIAACMRKGLSVACAHTSWDVAPGGVNDVLAGLLGLVETRPVRLTSGEFGLGRVGSMPEPTTVGGLLTILREVLHFDAVRTFAPLDAPVRTVAVGGGACAELVPDAILAGADALVTSDVRHHEFVDARHRSFALIDAGHHATETPGARELARKLATLLPDLDVTFAE